MKEIDSMEINATVTGKKEDESEDDDDDDNNNKTEVDLSKTLVTAGIGAVAGKLLSDRKRR